MIEIGQFLDNLAFVMRPPFFPEGFVCWKRLDDNRIELVIGNGHMVFEEDGGISESGYHLVDSGEWKIIKKAALEMLADQAP